MATKNELKPCPKCRAKAFVDHLKADGFDFGWSVGCPRYCNNDGIHGLDENAPREIRFAGHGYPTKEKAIEAWNDRVENGKWRIWPWK